DGARVLPHVADRAGEALVVEALRLHEAPLERVQVWRDRLAEDGERGAGARVEVAEVRVVGLVLPRDIDDVLDRARAAGDDRVAGVARDGAPRQVRANRRRVAGHAGGVGD